MHVSIYSESDLKYTTKYLSLITLDRNTICYDSYSIEVYILGKF